MVEPELQVYLVVRESNVAAALESNVLSILDEQAVEEVPVAEAGLQHYLFLVKQVVG